MYNLSFVCPTSLFPGRARAGFQILTRYLACRSKEILWGFYNFIALSYLRVKRWSSGLTSFLYIQSIMDCPFCVDLPCAADSVQHTQHTCTADCGRPCEKLECGRHHCGPRRYRVPNGLGLYTRREDCAVWKDNLRATALSTEDVSTVKMSMRNPARGGRTPRNSEQRKVDWRPNVLYWKERMPEMHLVGISRIMTDRFPLRDLVTTAWYFRRCIIAIYPRGR